VLGESSGLERGENSRNHAKVKEINRDPNLEAKLLYYTTGEGKEGGYVREERKEA